MFKVIIYTSGTEFYNTNNRLCTFEHSCNPLYKHIVSGSMLVLLSLLVMIMMIKGVAVMVETHLKNFKRSHIICGQVDQRL